MQNDKYIHHTGIDPNYQTTNQQLSVPADQL